MLLQQGEQVPVKIVLEPDNQYDSKAITFYDLHRALVQKKIDSIKFAWAKYLVVWMRSGPGYYAGINIALNGEWSCKVCCIASTH